mgnify:CR=1 FL=1
MSENIRLIRHSGRSLPYYLVCGVFLIGIFEGALQKWVGFPLSLSVVIRDLLAVSLIFYAVIYFKFRQMRSLSLVLLIWTILVILWGGMQSIFMGVPLAVFGSGIRFWFLYLWFAIAAAVVFSVDDIRKFYKLSLKVGLCIVGLAIVQSLLPPDNILNVQPNSIDESSIFLLAEGVVRVTGTFTFTLGYTAFIAFFAWVAISESLNPLMSRGIASAKSIILIIALVMAFAVSGSRSSILWGAIFFSIFFLFHRGEIRGGIIAKKIIILAVFFVLAGGAFIFLFPNLVEAYEVRFRTASEHEDFIGRIVIFFVGEQRVVDNFEMWGHGLGAGTNIGSKFLTGSTDGFYLSETEQGKIIGEMGVLGIFYVFFRALIVLKIIFWSFLDLKRRIDVGLGAAVIFYLLFLTPVSGQNSANFIFYICFMYLLFVYKITYLACNNKETV